MVIVAHSMGGLAAREAASLKVSGTHQSVSGLISRIITIATPNTGSWSDGLFHDLRAGSADVVDGIRPSDVAWLFQGICGAIGITNQIVNGATKRSRVCGILDGATSQAGSAMVPGSSQLAALPAPPSGVPLDEVAGQMTVTARLFGLGPYVLFPSGVLGDLLVKPDSALVYGSAPGDAAFTEPCTMSVHDVFEGQGWNGCTHGGLLYKKEVSTQVVSWVTTSAMQPDTNQAAAPCTSHALAAAAHTHAEQTGSFPGQSQLMSIYCQGQYAVGTFEPLGGGQGALIAWIEFNGAWQEVFQGSDGSEAGGDGIPGAIQMSMFQALFARSSLTTPVPF